VEALIALVAARVLVLVLPLRRIGPLVAQRKDRPGAAPGMVAAIAWALDAAGRRLPLRTACYERGIAACWMLARRGHDALLHYGVGQVDGQIAAHVWVTSAEHPVVGTEVAGDYTELARY
jgi:hypothetical protein